MGSRRLVTRHVQCTSPDCGIRYESQLYLDGVEGSELSMVTKCAYCGARATMTKPDRHKEPGQPLDMTPHQDKNAVGGY